MPLNKDSTANTFIVATVLCLVCSALVSFASVGLKKVQQRNVVEFQRTNILKVAGFTQEEIDSAGDVNEFFKEKFDTIIIDLETGEEAGEACRQAMVDAGKQVPDDVEEFVPVYDQQWCSKSKKPQVSDPLSKSEDIVGIKYREKYSHVYILKTDGKISKYVFPVRSYGLWSMMKGYLAVEPDLQTVAGLTFYEQGETPGLGGEIDNPTWQAKWPGKQIYEGGEVDLEVTKTAQPDDDTTVDALSGATITSNGVTNMVEFWLGEPGFKSFIDNRKPQGTAGTEVATPAESGVNHG